MIKKTLFLTFLYILIFSTTYAQNPKQEIEKTFTTYIDLVLNKDFRKSADYIFEDLYKIVSKEQLIQVLETTFNNPAMTYGIKNPKIIEVSDITKIDQKFYALLRYSNLLSMKFNEEKLLTEQEHQTRLQRIKTALDNTFGAEKVKLNSTTQFFEIYAEKQVCAISDDGLTGWKFIMMDKKQKPVLEKVLPLQLTKDL